MSTKPTSVILKAAKKTWRDYANESSVHGLKYAVGRRMLDRKLPPNVTAKEVERLIPFLLGFSMPVSVNRDLTPMEKFLTFNELTPSAIIRLLLPKCNKFLIRCKWQGTSMPCNDLFKRSKTKDGYCCSFNYNTDYRDPNFESMTSPYFGPGMGLSYVVDTMGMYNKQVYHVMDSFKIVLHLSNAYAGRFTNEMVMPLKSELQIALYPVKIVIGGQAQKLTPEGRKCYNLDEFPLKHFASYRKNDCLVECEIEKNVDRCGCQSYIYPRNEEDILCNATRINCLKHHFREVTSVTWGDNCTCPEQCNQNITDMVIHTTDLDTTHFNLDPFYNLLTENQSVIHVYYGSQFGTIVKKAIIAYWVDLVSSFGGVFNLFLGCSFLSVLEVLYFFLVKFPQNYFKSLNNTRKIDVKPFTEPK
ncbi:sodium channel protein Nach-like [Arctopsyche grandis]|uniref:sodium channel protein Nach-like n=1 Tax=Arctopsyche grandis TaxID=121162 RepID=UPI00406D839C